MSFDFAAARQTMVETQVRTNDVTDPAIQAAMRRTPRESFCGAATHLAYADTEVPYSPGRWLLRPRDAGKLLQAVAPRAGERALALSAPYLAALLAEMGLSVCEADAAEPVTGVFDVIVCEGAVPRAPASWREALAPNGRLGIVERDAGLGRCMVYLRTEDGVTGRPAFDSSAALMAGFEPAPAFSL